MLLCMETDARTSAGHAALRRGRISLSGQIYLVTFVTRHRLPIFRDCALARIACKAMTDPMVWQQSRLLAWVLMPDHWHGLIVLGDREALSAMVRRIKSNSSRCVRLERPELQGIWARAFHDRALRHEEAVATAARYVIQNPVRSGLVTSLSDYPYWNADWL